LGLTVSPPPTHSWICFFSFGVLAHSRIIIIINFYLFWDSTPRLRNWMIKFWAHDFTTTHSFINTFFWLGCACTPKDNYCHNFFYSLGPFTWTHKLNDKFWGLTIYFHLIIHGYTSFGLDVLAHWMIIIIINFLLVWDPTPGLWNQMIKFWAHEFTSICSFMDKFFWLGCTFTSKDNYYHIFFFYSF